MEMIESSADFSSDRKYRYSLTRIWDRKKGHVLFVCLNPSTADESVDDPTIRRCIRFAESWGFGGMVMVNLFAFRATVPKEMMACKEPVGTANTFYWRVEHEAASITIVAWGVRGSYKGIDKEFMYYVGDEVSCLGTTKEGQPKHPLYLKKTLKPIAFNLPGGEA
jgi:hypothetical protein